MKQQYLLDKIKNINHKKIQGLPLLRSAGPECVKGNDDCSCLYPQEWQ